MTRILPWRLYLQTALETLIAFYLSTFSLFMFFSHQGMQHLFWAIGMVLLYILVIGLCIKRVGSKLPLQAIMLIIPVAPFLALVIVLSLIPVLQFF